MESQAGVGGGRRGALAAGIIHGAGGTRLHVDGAVGALAGRQPLDLDRVEPAGDLDAHPGHRLGEGAQVLALLVQHWNAQDFVFGQYLYGGNCMHVADHTLCCEQTVGRPVGLVGTCMPLARVNAIGSWQTSLQINNEIPKHKLAHQILI